MATTKASESDVDIRAEFEALKDQVSQLVAALKVRGEEKTSKAQTRVEAEASHYKEAANERLHELFDTGSAGVDELSSKIREKPLASLALAFGIGYLLSKVTGKD